MQKRMAIKSTRNDLGVDQPSIRLGKQVEAGRSFLAIRVSQPLACLSRRSRLRDQARTRILNLVPVLVPTKFSSVSRDTVNLPYYLSNLLVRLYELVPTCSCRYLKAERSTKI